MGDMDTGTTLKCSVKDCTNDRADQRPNATNRHCEKHRAEGRKKWEETRMAQAAGKGFTRGIEAMREILVREFGAWGESQFTGREVATFIRNAPGPVAEMDDKARADLAEAENAPAIP